MLMGWSSSWSSSLSPLNMVLMRFSVPFRPTGGGAAQPDPLKTSVGYIGADSLSRQRKQEAQRQRSGPGGQRRTGRSR